MSAGELPTVASPSVGWEAACARTDRGGTLPPEARLLARGVASACAFVWAAGSIPADAWAAAGPSATAEQESAPPQAPARSKGGNLVSNLAPIQPGVDYHSYANTDQFRVTHLELDLKVDLDNHDIDGVVGLEVKRVDPSATQLVLDTKDLSIIGVAQKATDLMGATSKSQKTWVSRPFRLERADPILGSALIIDLPPDGKRTETVRIEYEVSRTAAALQWLNPKQTAGRKKPFLYTQSEPIGARSWIPLQDTPEVRITYDATIHTPRDVVAVMSARNDPKRKRNGEYTFAMPQAIPSYLLALAVGDLKYEATGPRTGVWAEPKTLKAAVKEFADTEAMMQACEKLFGGYRWERYDILVMPPSFPIGGMENPRLSFITPTVIAGDKSLVSVIAHELAHSWSGNLVTNATWRDEWLNEGFTTYLQGRIIEVVYGERRAAMEDVLGLETLRREFLRLKPADQVLAIDLRNRDPGLELSEVPYQKGRLFLRYLEAKYGRDRFDAFLKGYFERNSFKSLSTEDFLAYLTANLMNPNPGIVSADEVRAWVYQPGLPADAVLPKSDAFDVVDREREAWYGGRLPAKQLGRDWEVQQWLHFLDGIDRPVGTAQLAELDHAHKLTDSGNDLIEKSWLLIAIRNDYRPARPRLEAYLETIGREILVEPLYRELMKSTPGAELARRIYAKARPGYHSSTVQVIDALVEQDDKDDSE